LIGRRRVDHHDGLAHREVLEELAAQPQTARTHRIKRAKQYVGTHDVAQRLIMAHRPDHDQPLA
jgi:hypothetical protein